MPAGGEDRLVEALIRLRLEYLADSTQRIAELRALHERARNGDAAALDDLRRALHKLAGSGGSYGFPDVSEKGREGERLAQRLLDAGGAADPTGLEELRSLITSLAEAFEAARRSDVQRQP